MAENLLRALNQDGESVRQDNIRRDELFLGALEPAVNATLERLDREKFPRRFWDHDPTLWKDNAKHAKVIENAMGWLETPHEMLQHVDALSDFVSDCWKAGFKDAVLLGMGVSSLAADVCRPSFGAIPGGLKLHVLDSTLPGAIQAIEQQIEPRRTLFLVCSKSGRTTETLALYRYFYGKLRSLEGERAGENFVAITDEGSELYQEARHENFRAVLPGPRNAVGRYSVLSNFGMIPAALAGGDVRSVLESGQRMIEACQCCVPSQDNPGFKLGVILGEAWKAGRDKVTFIMSPSIDTFADWVEQLIAESTGKEGKSIVPVTHEPLGDASVYGSGGGSDRLFVHLYLVSEFDPALDTKLKVLEADGHPVVKIVLGDKPDIGREIVRWQVATATAGAVMGINPFDSPNVEESKENTRRLLVEYCASGELPNDMLCVGAGNISLYGRQSGTSLESYLESFLSQAIPRDYIAMMAFSRAQQRNGPST